MTQDLLVVDSCTLFMIKGDFNMKSNDLNSSFTSSVKKDFVNFNCSFQDGIQGFYEPRLVDLHFTAGDINL